MPVLDKNAEKRVISFLRDINMLLFLERSTDRVNRVLKLVEKMPELERDIINRKYIEPEAGYTWHYEIYRELGISEAHYTQTRRGALLKIAAEFGLLTLEEVSVGDDKEKSTLGRVLMPDSILP